ncbi:MAG: T9SS type A sorting domain-containing protein, partial [Ginsengibacter sp.]
SNNFTIRRFNADGSPDITFSDDGIEITNASVANNTIADIALSDEMLYAVGYGQYPGNLGVVARYLLPSGGPLPITLTDFTSALKNNRTLLQWQTASEYHLSHFTIERSVDGNNFSSLSDVVAYGNSSTKISYSAIDYEPLQGTNYYRLKLVDADGRFTYSKIATVNNNSQFSIRISPNPASNILFLQATGNTEKVNYQIINIEGRKLKEATIVLGNNTLYPINISGLSKGNYMINIQTKTGKESLRFIKD